MYSRTVIHENFREKLEEMGYKYLKELARGFFSVVILVRRKDKLLVLKVDRVGAPPSGHSIVELFSTANYAKDLANKDVPIAVQYDSFTIQVDETTHFITEMKYYPDGTLSDFIKNRKGEPLAPRILLEVYLKLLSALEALDKKDGVHFDLKPGNILVVIRDKEIVEVSFCDLSTYRRGGKELILTSVGSEYYYPNTLGHFHKGDLYALGLVFLELLFGKVPWVILDQFMYDREQNLRMLDMLKDSLLKRYNGECTEKELTEVVSLLEVVFGMLNKNPAERPNATRALKQMREVVVGDPSGPSQEPDNISGSKRKHDEVDDSVDDEEKSHSH